MHRQLHAMCTALHQSSSLSLGAADLSTLCLQDMKQWFLSRCELCRVATCANHMENLCICNCPVPLVATPRLDASSCPGTRHTWLRSILRSSHHLQPVAKENIPNKKDVQQYYFVASINVLTSSSSGLLRLIPTMVPTFAINPQTVTINTVRSTWLVDRQLCNHGN